MDYCDKKNFPSILTKNLFEGSYNKKYAQELKSWLKDIEISSIQSLLLE